MDFAAQLLSAGQCHLAVYVMHHMATSAEHPEVLERAIRSVLDLYCPLWVESREQKAFMEEYLKVPPHWLAASEVMMTTRMADVRQRHSWRSFAHFFLLFAFFLRLFLHLVDLFIPYCVLQHCPMFMYVSHSTIF